MGFCWRGGCSKGGGGGEVGGGEGWVGECFISSVERNIPALETVEYIVR